MKVEGTFWWPVMSRNSRISQNLIMIITGMYIQTMKGFLTSPYPVPDFYSVAKCRRLVGFLYVGPPMYKTRLLCTLRTDDGIEKGAGEAYLLPHRNNHNMLLSVRGPQSLPQHFGLQSMNTHKAQCLYPVPHLFVMD